MSNVDSALLKAVQTKLQNLVTCVMAKAAEDSSFARELEGVLLSEDLKKKIIRAPRKSKIVALNPVTILHAKGEPGLRAEMEILTDDELRQVAHLEGLMKGRDLKTTARADLIREILSSAKHRLTQGEAFLKPHI
jgi:hypothetical protein